MDGMAGMDGMDGMDGMAGMAGMVGMAGMDGVDEMGGQMTHVFGRLRIAQYHNLDNFKINPHRT